MRNQIQQAAALQFAAISPQASILARIGRRAAGLARRRASKEGWRTWRSRR